MTNVRGHFSENSKTQILCHDGVINRISYRRLGPLNGHFTCAYIVGYDFEGSLLNSSVMSFSNSFGNPRVNALLAR